MAKAEKGKALLEKVLYLFLEGPAFQRLKPGPAEPADGQDSQLAKAAEGIGSQRSLWPPDHWSSH